MRSFVIVILSMFLAIIPAFAIMKRAIYYGKSKNYSEMLFLVWWGVLWCMMATIGFIGT